MPSAALVACALLRLAAGQSTSYDLAVRSEGRGLVLVQSGQSTRLVEGSVDPRLALKVETPTGSLELAYAPRFTASTVAARAEAFHQAILALGYRPDPRLKLSGAAAGAVGAINLLSPAAAPAQAGGTTAVDLVGGQSRLRYVLAEASSALEVLPVRRARLVLLGSYTVTGGEDFEARRTLPLQRGPRAALTAEWQTAPSDALVTEAEASTRAFTISPVRGPGPDRTIPPVWLASITETWRRRVETGVSAWVGLGAAWSGSGDSPRSLGLVPPRVDLGLSVVPASGAGHLQLSARYGPVIDAISGRAYQRIELGTSTTWSLTRTLGWGADLTSGVALGGAQDGETMSRAELRLVHKLSRELELSWGPRWLWQRAPDRSASPSYRQYGLFVALAYLQRGSL
jgi:hypothetical protein